ncbi:MAG: 30S ribosomal protein S16 [Deltaproteobacteria bacterium]|nr:30S ribosomal protein S16 [Deltaproteobacteria bacterium]MBW2120773.1 30S ribosomal protein S16 [Deltaproteobacteria bacterium]
MAVSIRLARFGAKKRPTYRIVVTDSRSPRDGRFIERIGTYDPNQDPAAVRIEEDKAIQWMERGARPTQTVRRLMKESGLFDKMVKGSKA